MSEDSTYQPVQFRDETRTLSVDPIEFISRSPIEQTRQVELCGLENKLVRTLHPTSSPNGEKEPRNLVLFFDGTGNEFTGTDKDTNVVKLLNMMDRNHPNQFHYYQTGIGTYDVKERTVHKTSFGEMKSSFWKKVDQGFGTTFDAHVMSGYRFLMRYYEPGDKIYMFGFSRGAYTAKFLARMVYTVGLLCKGNEEMVPFAYRLYQRHLNGEFKAAVDEHNHVPDHDLDASPEKMCTAATCELVAFSETFCWKEEHAKRCNGDQANTNIKVFFLGLWDCVNSVSVMEKKTTLDVKVKGTADIIRHAVAVDERRVKFKATLFHQDKAQNESGGRREHVKEVWFPGNHGDIGGGWHPKDDELRSDDKNASFSTRLNSWRTLKKVRRENRKEENRVNDRSDCEEHHDNFEELEACEIKHMEVCAKRPCRKTKKHGRQNYCFHEHRMRQCQLSDTPLAWMIRELELADKQEPGCGDYWRRASGIKWHTPKLDGFKVRYQYHMNEVALGSARPGSVHDPLMFGFGDSIGTVLFWNFLEFFPLIKRWELKPKPKGQSDSDDQSSQSSQNIYDGKRRIGGKCDKDCKGSKDDTCGPKVKDASLDRWKWQMFPLNMGGTRDIPEDAWLHVSLVDRLNRDDSYCPRNDHGETDACLKVKGGTGAMKNIVVMDSCDSSEPLLLTYKFEAKKPVAPN